MEIVDRIFSKTVAVIFEQSTKIKKIFVEISTGIFEENAEIGKKIPPKFWLKIPRQLQLEYLALMPLISLSKIN